MCVCVCVGGGGGGGELLQLFFKWDVSKIEHMMFCFAWKPQKCKAEPNLGPEKMFSGIKNDFFRILVDSRG